jgi:hypothetical protein
MEIGMTTRQVQLGTSAYTTTEDDAKLSTVRDLSLLLQLGDELSPGTAGDLSLDYSWGRTSPGKLQLGIGLTTRQVQLGP